MKTYSQITVDLSFWFFDFSLVCCFFFHFFFTMFFTVSWYKCMWFLWLMNKRNDNDHNKSKGIHAHTKPVAIHKNGTTAKTKIEEENNNNHAQHILEIIAKDNISFDSLMGFSKLRPTEIVKETRSAKGKAFRHFFFFLSKYHNNIMCELWVC